MLAKNPGKFILLKDACSNGIFVLILISLGQKLAQIEIFWNKKKNPVGPKKT